VTRGADRIVCPSRSIEALVHARNAGLPTTVVPYGFETGRYRLDRPREARILAVSRLLRRKGVQDLLAAVAETALPFEVHVVGDGPYLETLRRRALGSATPVIFHGWLDNRSPELTSLYETSKIFVLPSEAENFPVSLMEAMAAGLAVVTSRGTGCAEVVGDAGLLVTPGRPAELREVLLRLAANPGEVEAYGRRARQRLARDLSWASIADRHEALYREHLSLGDAA
jgi:glycosyltransferase involved in cell wall biosynthesis